MDTNDWTAHCFGRFLVDLPPEARIVATYSLWGDEFKKIPVSPNEVAGLVGARESELRSAPHDSEEGMLIRTDRYDGGSASLLSWRRPESVSAMWLDAYFVGSGGHSVYEYQGLIEPAREHLAAAFTSQLAGSVRSRRQHEIPTEPGFCIDGGYIAGSEYMSESFRVGITLPQHPGMHMTFRSSTGAEEEGLLERVGGFFRTEVLGRALGVDTLRKRRRSVGPIAGEEYLVAGGDDRQRVYAFRWEFQGRDDSLAEPNLSLEMGVLERDPGDDGSLPPPAFESDDEALQLWDAILETIRPRPGAA